MAPRGAGRWADNRRVRAHADRTIYAFLILASRDPKGLPPGSPASLPKAPPHEPRQRPHGNAHKCRSIGGVCHEAPLSCPYHGGGKPLASKSRRRAPSGAEHLPERRHHGNQQHQEPARTRPRRHRRKAQRARPHSARRDRDPQSQRAQAQGRSSSDAFVCCHAIPSSTGSTFLGYAVNLCSTSIDSRRFTRFPV